MTSCGRNGIAGRPARRLATRSFLVASVIWLSVPIMVRAETVVIRAGRLVEPEAGTATRDQVILIEGSTIQAVGPDVPIPPHARLIDLSDSTVLPGLFDCHNHLCVTVIGQPDLPRTSTGGTGAAFMSTLLYTTAYRALQGVSNAESMLEAGFTTVRDLGNNANYADTDLRRAIEEGLVLGPTMVNAGRIIAPFGGQFTLQPDRRTLVEPEYFLADTREELKKAIRENVHFGARVIKIVVDDQLYAYTVDDIRFIIDEAADMGLKVAAHCRTAEGARRAAAAGVASIEHGMQMTDETLELAKQNGVVLVPTDFPKLVLEAMNWAGVRGATRSDPNRFYNMFVERLRRAYRIGVKLAFGTDGSWPVPGYSRGELSTVFIETYVDAGVPPAEILRAMTTNAAELLGLNETRGSIRPGLAADIVATPENPLEDIETLKRVTFVMKDGRVVKHSGNDRNE